MTPAHTKSRHLRLLFALLALELCLLGNLWLNKQPAQAILGFLIKNGAQYTVAWKQDNNEYHTRTYDTLRDALLFVREDLKLSNGRNPLPDHELEHVWLNNRFGNSVLLWKTLKFSYLNQLTFQNKDDARYFLDAFRQGSYAPSIFGHSILLVPKSSQFN